MGKVKFLDLVWSLTFKWVPAIFISLALWVWIFKTIGWLLDFFTGIPHVQS